MKGLDILDIKELSLDGIKALDGKVLTFRELEALRQNELVTHVELLDISYTSSVNNYGDTVDTNTLEFIIYFTLSLLAVVKVKGVHTIE